MWCYYLYNKNKELIYIGKSNNIYNRIKHIRLNYKNLRTCFIFFFFFLNFKRLLMN